METQVIQFVPKLSATGKMPCPSFSTPAQACKTGSKLAKIKGSVCHGCYALKGNYHYPNVKAPRAHNLALLDDLAAWVPAMVQAISSSKHGGFFRWHDSGDLQSVDHLAAIADIAEALPGVQFWLPTKEAGMVKEFMQGGGYVPENLVIRISMPMVDQQPRLPKSIGWQARILTSTVHQNGPAHGFECKAYTQGGKCLTCRACWSRDVPNVSYPKH